MKQMSFSEINDLENGQRIPALTGTIKKVFDQKSDVGQYGQWWLQNIILQDDHANELQITWACEDPWTSKDEGKTLLFESGHDKKDQLVGIKREIRLKNGKKYESVKVDDRAKVKPVNGEPIQRDTTDEYLDEFGAITKRKDAAVKMGELSKPISEIDEARKHIMQSANLYVLCVNAVNKYVAEHLPEVAQTSEMFQAATGTLFIEASRAGFVNKMPQTPIK